MTTHVGCRYSHLTHPTETVQADWRYCYDTADFLNAGGPEGDWPWLVEPRWVGKRACDVTSDWQSFLKPL